jgi:hypothetical protein
MLGREPVDLVELREICNDIVSEDQRASQVIRRLGELYRGSEMKMEPLDLNELICETLDLVRTELLTRHIAAHRSRSWPAYDRRWSRAIAAGPAESDSQRFGRHDRSECRGASADGSIRVGRGRRSDVRG